ncbi:MAG: hypothetical protein BMS9Abin02_1414 [Anaerolineae bacterium]|nr:MAG: hypothetical protein BMS9Abin02_1414 [Anaerolineae bacterium]
MGPFRVKAILLSIALASAMLAAFIAVANTLNLQEAQLSPGSSVWEISSSKDGRLFISHPGADEIWQEMAADNFTVYQNITNVQDAKSDSQGYIWWSDKGSKFGRISTPTQVITTWQLPDGQKIWGLAIDNQDKLWLTGWTGAESKLFNFDVVSSQLCTYTLPPSTNSHYVVYEDGELWLGNRVEDRIYRLTESVTQTLATWWDLPDELDIGPNGLIPDGGGNLWWADQQLGGLGFLDSSTDQLTFYTLPLGAEPQMVLKESDWIWYTEFTSNTSGTIGALDPKAAEYFTATLITNSAIITPVCDSLEYLNSAKAVTRTEILTWTVPVTLTPSYAQDGWWIYEIAAEPYGLAERGSELYVTDQSSQKLLRMPLPIFGQLNLSVTASVTEAVHGGDIEYSYAVTYTSRDDSPAKDIVLEDDGCEPVIGPTGDVNVDGLLDVGEIWQYSCTAVIGVHVDDETVITGTVSTAMVSGKDADDFVIESATKITVVPLVHDKGLLNIKKDGPVSAAHGESVTFDYSATYNSQDGAPATSVAVGDDKCSGISLPGGDSDGDGRLDVNETWTYSCQTTVPDHVEDEEKPWSNEVTLEGNNFDGDHLQPAKDQHEISFVHTRGRLFISKFGPDLGEHGEEATFFFIAVFENDDRSAANNVEVIDDKCSSVKLISGDNNADDKLNVGEFWLFRCRYVVSLHKPGEENPIINKAVGRGKNEDGKNVLTGVDQHRMMIVDGRVFLPITRG